MNELRGFNAPKLYQKLALSDSDFLKWLQELDILPKEMICECGQNMNYKWQTNKNYPAWRCTKKICRKEKGFLKGSWFEGTHLSLKEVVDFVRFLSFFCS